MERKFTQAFLSLLVLFTYSCGPINAYVGPLRSDSEIATISVNQRNVHGFTIDNLIVIEVDSNKMKSTPHNRAARPVNVLPGPTRLAVYWGYTNPDLAATIFSSLTRLRERSGICLVKFDTSAGRKYELNLVVGGTLIIVKDDLGKDSVVPCEEGQQ